LEAEIARYSGAAEARIMEADIWMRIEGSSDTHDISMMQLSSAVNGLRLGVFDVASYVSKHSSKVGVRPSRLRAACDFSVTASDVGSLRLGIDIHKFTHSTGHNGANPEEDAILGALADYLKMASVVASSAQARIGINSGVRDPAFEEVLLRAINRLVPNEGSVELYGKLVGKDPIRLPCDSRVWLDAKLDKSSDFTPELQKEYDEVGARGFMIDEVARQKLIQGSTVAVEGELRRVNLDASSILVRDSEGQRDYECMFDELLLDKVRQAIGRNVKLHLRTAGPEAPGVFTVTDLELLE
jgi:hypothetical protein